MKNTKTCPKCGSRAVAEVPGGSFSPLGRSGSIETDPFETARIDRWICCACGYSEAWIEPKKLQKIRKRWLKNH